MRSFFTLLSLAAFIAASSQKPDLTDSMSKYSYLIQIKAGDAKTQATGFFARYQHRLFLVTAAHCITGWDPFRFQKIEGFPDTVFIRTSNDTSKLHFLPLPVAGIKQNTRPFREYETPDVCVIEVKNPAAYRVYSVEKYFGEQVRCETAKSIYLYGYPKSGEVLTEYYADRQQPAGCSGSLGEAYCVFPFRPEAKRPDELNYSTQFEDRPADVGLSGAPAYLLTESKHIVFGGVYIGGADKGLRTGMIVRPEYVIDKIMAKIASR